MKQTFKVEILGYEYDTYCGADGHYNGTSCTPNLIVDFLELSDKYADMQVSFFEGKRGLVMEISEHRDYLYWAPSYYRCIREVGTRNMGIRISKELFDQMVFRALGWSGYIKGHFDEYNKEYNNLLKSLWTVKEIQDILKSI